ncbi:hypothetical protein [Maribacter arcticus]|uniref:hypothetical protein n=1 Tax=Maribacter arcticus TaxID=561365 RepID=UPI0030016D63
MKFFRFIKILAIVYLFFISVNLSAQVTIWSEDFSSYSNGTISGAGTGTSSAAWNSQTGAAVNAGRILASNTRNQGSSLGNPLIWLTNPIDISSYTNVNFSLNTGAFDTNQFEDSGGSQDNFTLEYRINGGSWTQVFSRSGSTSQPINASYTINGLSGLNLEIRASFHTTASNENYTIDNILVTGTASAPNEPPVLTTTGNQLYCPGTAMPVVETVSLTDTDDTTAFAVAIQISSGYINGEDLLTLTGTHPSITASWSAVEGKLTLTGPATLAAFESAISNVEYSSSAPNPSGSRDFSITVGDANFLPTTGHYYEYVDAIGITWTAANAAASARTYFGLQGYLATLTSQVEADFSGSQALGVGWIGGSDAATEGVWLWVTGPESGTNFWNGTAGGSSPNFAFWNTGEPNQSGDEDYAHITHPNVNPNGSWNDLTNTGAASGNYQPQGYVVEYGGMPSDPVLSITGTSTIRMDDVSPTASNPAPLTVYCSGDIPAADPAVVTNEADNCTTNPSVTFQSEVTDGGNNPETITRTYRISDASGNTTDVVHVISVYPVLINSQPADLSVFAGTNAIVSVATSNADSYQWQLSTNAGGSYTNISDGSAYSNTNTASLTVLSPQLSMNGYLYRVIINNTAAISCADLVSNPAGLTVRISSVITNRRITYRVNRN